MTSPTASGDASWLPSGTDPLSAYLNASGLAERVAGLDTSAGQVGVWGRRQSLTHALREGDRVEIWRPLRVDPKLARRERFGQQGARTAGLFAQRRPGAKQGY